jgi:hypothetical protein
MSSSERLVDSKAANTIALIGRNLLSSMHASRLEYSFDEGVMEPRSVEIVETVIFDVRSLRSRFGSSFQPSI